MFTRKFTKRCTNCGGELASLHRNYGTLIMRRKEPIFDIEEHLIKYYGETYSDSNESSLGFYFVAKEINIKNKKTYSTYNPRRKTKTEASIEKLQPSMYFKESAIGRIRTIKRYGYNDYMCKRCGKDFMCLVDSEKQPYANKTMHHLQRSQRKYAI